MLRNLLLGALLAAFCAAALPAQEKIYFSREFPGSVPGYFETHVARDGSVLYKEAVNDEFPIEFQIEPETADRLFSLIAGLDFAAVPSKRKKVAFTGNKVLRYERPGGASAQAQFVFTQDDDALELTQWFLMVAETERHFIELERVLQFDRLGINDALLNLQRSYDRERVVAPKQFLPLLEKIVEQKRILHLARSRASALIERINGIGPDAK